MASLYTCLKRAYLKQTFLCVLTILLLSYFSSAYLAKAAATTMYVDPQVSNVAPTDIFSVNITIADVANLTGWEFKLFYLKSILNCSVIVEGPFLKSAGSTFKTFNITNNYNSTHGRILAGCILLGGGASVNGTGVAAFVTFKALALGNTPLDLVDTKLSDASPPPAQPIPHTVIDGVVHISGGSLPDVAVTAVEPAKTIVGKSYTCRVNATVENHGGFEVTFGVTAYANSTSFGSRVITLSVGNSVVLVYVWNSSDFDYGNYTVSVTADTIPGEADIGDNTYVSSIQVHVGVPGDVSGPTQGVYDNTVNMRDIQYMILLFNTNPSSPNWKPNADVNNDGVCNMRDIQIAILNFNKHE